MTEVLKIDYVEFTSLDFEEEMTFFTDAFGWGGESYGENYMALDKTGLDGGLERATQTAPLIVLYSQDLEVAMDQVVEAGGEVTCDIFEFPGGRRFEFVTPGGTAMAVWTKDGD
ncbi:VOC family protein [Roseovarius aestuarii]|nr:VOC family protein [Roseovarius aestuarii]